MLKIKLEKNSRSVKLLDSQEMKGEGRWDDAQETRVTIFGEFSLVGRLFTLGRFPKITEVAHIFELLFSTVKFINRF
jgi:hypothetical protein